MNAHEAINPLDTIFTVGCRECEKFATRFLQPKYVNGWLSQRVMLKAFDQSFLVAAGRRGLKRDVQRLALAQQHYWQGKKRNERK